MKGTKTQNKAPPQKCSQSLFCVSQLLLSTRLALEYSTYSALLHWGKLAFSFPETLISKWLLG